MKIKSIFLLSILSTLLFVNCTDGFDNLNKDPNRIAENDYDFSLIDVGSSVKYFGNYNYVLPNEALAGGAHLWERIRILTMDGYAQYNTGGYGSNDAWQSDYWGGHYSTYVGLLNGVIRDANKYPNRENSKSYARIWRVYVQSMFTDYFGSAPFSLDPLDPNPDYMPLDQLYPIMFAELDEAPKQFDPAKKTMNNGLDPFFDGDIVKWKRFANSLRLRLAIKMSEIDPELCKKEVLAALKADGGLITEGNDAGSPPYEKWGNTYPYTVISWGQISMTSTMEKMLTNIGGTPYSGTATNHPANVDPRGELMFDPSLPDSTAKSYWQGMNMAMADASSMLPTVAQMSRKNLRSVPDRKIEHLPYYEVCFLLAEAVERGFVSDGDAKGTAKEWYEKGVRESFKKWGIDSKAAAYLASTAKNSWGTSASYDDIAGAGNTRLEKIVTQRYIASYPDLALQVWNDKRRLNLPAMDIPQVRDNGVGSWPTDNSIKNPLNYVQRSLYPQNEKLINTSKYNAGVAQLQGGDKTSSVIWWASQKKNYCTSN